MSHWVRTHGDRPYCIPDTDIFDRIAEMGVEVRRDYLSQTVSSLPLVVIHMLDGSCRFRDVLLTLMGVVHFEVGTIRTSFRVLSPIESKVVVDSIVVPKGGLEGWHVLLVADVVDTGASLTLATSLLKMFGPRSVKTAVMLQKDAAPEEYIGPDIDYLGFLIPPDVWVVGFGMGDSDEEQESEMISELLLDPVGNSAIDEFGNYII